MILKKFLIAGGNPTLLVWDCPPSLKSRTIEKFLGEVDQIGFIGESPNSTPQLTMMGDELCVNATIALASQLGNNGKLSTGGVRNPVKYRNSSNKTAIELYLPFKANGNLVLLPGIGFICLPKLIRKVKVTKKFLSDLANQYRLPAFGVVLYDGDEIVPYVYVKKTDSLFKETACGSGSIALNIATGLENIVQPTGSLLSVRRSDQQFTVEAKVVKMER